MLIPMKSITDDNALQPREGGTDPDMVDEYADALHDGAKFPDVVVYDDEAGVRWLSEGFTRYAAHEQAGFKKIGAEIRKGTRQDALLNAAKSNQIHGVRRTNADKRRAVEMVLSVQPDWSDRRIADHVGVSRMLVGEARQVSESDTSTRTGSDGKQYPVAPRTYTIPDPKPVAPEEDGPLFVTVAGRRLPAELLRREGEFVWVKLAKPGIFQEIAVPEGWTDQGN